MKMKMKKLLIFCISLNIVLAAGLALVFYLGRNEKARYDKEYSLREESIRAESLEMLEKAGVLYAEKEYLDARVNLKMVSYRNFDRINSEKAKMIGMGEWYFFESDVIDDINEEIENEFYTFIGAARSLIVGEELSEEENNIIDKIRISHDNRIFSQNVYPTLNSKAEISENNAYKKALSVLGDKVVIEKCDNTLFPLAYTYSGKNTFVSISQLGGKVLKLYFYPGDSDYEIDEKTALETMRNFFIKERIQDVKLVSVNKEDGVYYAIFVNSKNADASIIIGVKGSGGRVCVFDAEEYYKHYRT